MANSNQNIPAGRTPDTSSNRGVDGFVSASPADLPRVDAAQQISSLSLNTPEMTYVDESSLENTEAPVVVQSGDAAMTTGSLINGVKTDTTDKLVKFHRRSNRTSVLIASATILLALLIAGMGFAFSRRVAQQSQAVENQVTERNADISGLQVVDDITLGLPSEQQKLFVNGDASFTGNISAANFDGNFRGNFDGRFSGDGSGIQNIKASNCDDCVLLQPNTPGVAQAGNIRVSGAGLFSQLGVGTATPGYTVDVVGDINASNSLKVNGVTVCTAAGCGNTASVTSVNGLNGALVIANASGAGTTITINDASTSGKGIAQFSATNFLVSGGTVNTIQDITTTSSPSFNGISLSGDLTLSNSGIVYSNNISQTAAGNAIVVDAGAEQVTFQANGRTFEFPTTGPATQTICTTGISCVAGGGQAVLIAPGSAQTDSVADVSIFINDTGGGNLLQLQSSGIDRFTVGNTGNTTISGSLAVNTITPSSAFTVGSAGQSFTLQGNSSSTITASNGGFTSAVSFATPTANRTVVIPNASGTVAVSASGNIALDAAGNITFTGTLPIANGGTNATDAATARSNLGAAASGANGDITSTTALNTITPSGALTVGATSQAFTLQGTATSVITAANGGNTTTLGFVTPTANVILNFPALSAGTYQLCTTSGNCAGVGGGVSTVGGTTGALAKFTGSQVIGDSIITEAGSVITIGGDQVIQGSGGLTIGTGATLGRLLFRDGTSSFSATIQPATLTAGRTITLPNASGTLAVSASGNIALSAAGDISFTGVLPIANGGTNASDAATARSNLGAAASGANSDITSTTALNTITPSGALVVGATGQQMTLQGNASSVVTATSGGNVTTFGFATPTANTTINLPALSAGTYQVCTTSGNCLGGGSGGANTALSNLTSVAINTSLLPGAAGTINLGSNTLPFGTLNLAGTSGTPGTNNFVLTGASTGGTRTITLPDASGTVAVSASGNIALSATGNITFTGTLPIANGGTNATDAATARSNLGAAASGANGDITSTTALNTITPSGALTVGATSQAFTLQGTAASAITATNGGNVTTIGFVTPTANVTLNFPALAAGTYQFCTTSGNCASGGNVSTVGGTTNALAKFTGATAIGDSIITDNGTLVTIAGAAEIQGSGGITVGTGSVLGRALFRDGSSAFAATLQPATLSADRTITIPNAAGTLAVSASGNIALDASGNITFTGTLPIANGGTNATDAATARSNLGAAASGANSDITSTSALNTITPSGALTVGATSQAFTMQGTAASLITGTNGGNVTTFGFVTPTANVTINLPALSAGTYQVCTTSGNCLGGSGAANTSLSNLSSVAINTSLLPGATNIDLGSNAAPFRDLYLGGTGTNNFRFTGTASGARTLTVPDASGTLAVSASGNIALSGAGNITFTGTLPIASGGTSATDAATARSNLGAAASGANSDITSTTALNTITPSGALTVGATTQAFTLQGSASSVIAATGGGFTTTVGFSGTPTGNVNYNFDRAAAAGTYTICTTVGNCAGSGGGVTTAGGTTGAIPKFTGSQTLGDSIISESTGVITIAGDAVLQGSGGISIGVASSVTGTILLNNATNGNTVSIQSGVTSGSYTLTLPTAAGSNGDCLTTTGSGVLVFAACTGGAGGGVTSINSQTGVVSLANASGSAGTITIDNASTSAKGIAQFNSTNFTASSGTINTIQDIATSSSPSFAGLSVTSGGASIVGNSTIATTAGNTLSVGNGTGTLTTTGSSSSTFVFNGVTVSVAEFNLLDGRDAALVDTNDAVNTAITGTGALNSGSITSGFGAIDTGADNITTSGTIQGGNVNATTALQTAGTSRVDASGNLVNIGNLTASASITIASTGAGSDVTLNAVDDIILSASGSITLTGFNCSSSANGGVLTTDASGNVICGDDDGGGSAPTLQTTYDNDVDGSNAIIALSSSDDSIIIRNPSSAGTDSGYAFRIEQLNTGGVDAFQVQNDGTGTLATFEATSTGTTATGILIRQTSSGAITTALDVSDAEIATALAIGSNDIVTSGATISSTELDRLDGKDAALVDTNDAVATAITGTGALNAGSITSGFGSIDTGADNITTTGTIQGTTSVLSQSFDRTSAGALNIGASTATSIVLGQNTSLTGAATFTSGTGTVLLQGNTDIAATVSLATRRGTTYTTAGSANDVAISTASLYLLDTSGSAQTITGIAAGRDGQILTLVNTDAALSVTINDNDAASSAANRISTGLGAPVSLAPGAAITLVYDAATSLWRMVGGVAGGAGTCAGCANTALSNLSSTNINTALNATSGNLNLTTTTSGNIVLNSAGTIELQDNTNVTGAFAASTTITAGTGLTVTAGGANIAGNSTIATTAGNTLSLGNSTGALTVTGNSSTTFVINGTTVDATEFNLLNGRDNALVDTNDAVATAITGTGALNSGSITSGFGAIDTGADNITTTGTVQGTTSVLTSSLDRVSAGALNIGSTTATSIVLGQNTSLNGTATFTSGTGAVLLQGNTDVAATVSLATRRGTTYTTAGSANDVAISTASLYLLDTSGAAQTITGIAAGRDGQILTLVNTDAALGVTLTDNDAASSAANRISTGTGASVSLAPGAAITLVYDSNASLWRMVGGVAGGAGTCPTCANQQLSNLSSTNINTALNATSGNLNLTTTTSGNIVLNSAGTIELQDATNVTGAFAASTTITAGTGLTVTAGGASIAGNSTIATTAGNTLSIGNSTGALTVSGNSSTTFVINGTTVDATEFNLLNGRDTALVDTNDAVGTAITGTGALNSGSITSGFGAIDIGADTITSGLINGQTISSAANFTGTLAVQGATLTVGTTTQAGSIVLNEDTNNNTVTINTGTQATGSFSVGFPTLAANDTFCLATAANCPGSGDAVTVNSTAATGANFLNTSSTSSVAGTTWSIDTGASPDDITVAIAVATGTTAGVVDANSQTFGGAKTFSALLTGNAGLTLSGASSQLTFSGVTTDITTGSNEALTISPNGSGDVIITVDSNTQLQVVQGNGGVPTLATGTLQYLQNNSASGDDAYLQIIAGFSGEAGIYFGDDTQVDEGSIVLDLSTNTLNFGTDNATRLSLSSTGVLTATNTVSIQGATTDITTGTNEDLTVVANGSGSILLNDSVTLGSASTDLLTVNATLQGTNALVFEGSSADANETTFAITNPTADQTVTFADASGTVALNTSGSSTAGVSAFVQGGNTWAGTATLGTNDANSLVFETNNQAAVTIASGGAVTLQNASNSANAFRVQDANGVNALRVGTNQISVLPNLVTNGSVEINTTGWSARAGTTMNRVTTYANKGDYSLEAQTNASGEGVNYAISLTSATQYTMSFMARVSAGSGNILTYGYAEDGSTETDCKTSQSVPNTSGWRLHNCTFTTGTVTGSPYFYIKVSNATSRNLYIDSFQMVADDNVGSYGEGTIDLDGIVRSPVSIRTVEDSSSALSVQSSNGRGVFSVDTNLLRVGIGLDKPTAQLTIGNVIPGDDSLTINQGSTGAGISVNLSNTSGSSGTGLTIDRSGAGGTTNSAVVITQTNGTLNNGILFDGVIGTDITTSNNRSLNIAAAGVGQIYLNDVVNTGALHVIDIADITVTDSNAFAVKDGVSTTIFEVDTSGAVVYSYANTVLGDTALDLLTVNATLQGTNALVFEGSSADANETTLAVTNPTADRTITLPDATGTVVLATSGSSTTGVSAFVQGGNTWAGTATLGTNDSNSLVLETNNTVALTLNSSQNATFSGDVVVAASKSLTLTGGNTASRPGSPTEGMMYYDSDTDRVLVYANGKWQADRADRIYVAASNSSQLDKDIADYVADGNGGGAGDGDQVQINSALTAAGNSKEVVLLPGTYVADASITIPNGGKLLGTKRESTTIELADLDASDNLIDLTLSGSIENITLDGRDDLNTAGTQVGISVSAGIVNANNLVLTRFRTEAIYIYSAASSNRITNSLFDTFTTAIRLENVRHSEISGNYFTGAAAGTAVLADDVAAVTISGNTFYDVAYGVDVGGTSNEVLISENNFETVATRSISIGGSSTATRVIDNYFYDSAYGVYATGTSSLQITGNKLRSMSNGLYLSSTTDSLIDSNNIVSVSPYAIQLSGVNYTIVSNNRITDSGGTTANDAIYLSTSDNNSIIGNYISDSSCNTTCYAINISDSASDKNYLESNVYTDTDADSGDDASINDAGTGTVYVGQQTNTVSSNNVSDFLFRGANSATAFAIQNASGTSMLNVDTSSALITASAALTLSGASSSLTFSGVTTDITTGTNETLTVTANGTGDIVLSTDADTNLQLTPSSASTTDLFSIDGTAGSGITTDNVDGIYINIEGANGTSTDVSGINIDFDPITGSSDDTFTGLLIQGITGTSAVENGLTVGSGWDANLFFNDTTTQIQIADGGTYTFEDVAGNDLLTVTDSGTTGAVTITGSLTVSSILSSGNIALGTSDTTGTLLVLDTKTDSGDPTGVNGGMYYNSNMGKFRCYEAGIWTNCSDPSSISGAIVMHEDFFSTNVGNSNTIGTHGWTNDNTVCTFSNLTYSNSDTPDRPGILDLSTGTATTGCNLLRMGQLNSWQVGGSTTIETAVRIPTLSDGTNEYDFRAGLSDGLAGQGTDGVYFEYDRNTSANWTLVTAAGGTRTKVTNTASNCSAGGSATAVSASTWYRLKAVIDSAGSQVDFYINDTFVGCSTTNIPSGTQATQPNIHILKSAGTTSRSVEVDYYSLVRPLSTKR